MNKLYQAVGPPDIRGLGIKAQPLFFFITKFGVVGCLAGGHFPFHQKLA
jgi:hypothetical protein